METQQMLKHILNTRKRCCAGEAGQIGLSSGSMAFTSLLFRRATEQLTPVIFRMALHVLPFSFSGALRQRDSLQYVALPRVAYYSLAPAEKQTETSE